MIPANHSSGEPPKDTKRDFTAAFIRHAHQILFAGYQRLNAKGYSRSEEDEITGDLAAEMNEVISNNPAPWMRSLQVHDQHPVTERGKPGSVRRVGKRRWKIDLKFVANTGSGMRHFCWEAKRLGTGNAIGTYLGADGLGGFLNARYSADCDFGGMLGYAQAGDTGSWYDKLAQRIPDITTPDDFPTDSRCSNHDRPELERAIEIIHTILNFN